MSARPLPGDDTASAEAVPRESDQSADDPRPKLSGLHKRQKGHPHEDGSDEKGDLDLGAIRETLHDLRELLAPGSSLWKALSERSTTSDDPRPRRSASRSAQIRPELRIGLIGFAGGFLAGWLFGALSPGWSGANRGLFGRIFTWHRRKRSLL